jgi:hypothetical protein
MPLLHGSEAECAGRACSETAQRASQATQEGVTTDNDTSWGRAWRGSRKLLILWWS